MVPRRGFGPVKLSLASTTSIVGQTQRQFIESDLRVLAVVAEHLELGNDADDVHYALNSGSEMPVLAPLLLLL